MGTVKQQEKNDDKRYDVENTINVINTAINNTKTYTAGNIQHYKTDDRWVIYFPDLNRIPTMGGTFIQRCNKYTKTLCKQNNSK